MKDHFIVGDVHGCLHTLQALLKKWKPKNQQLIFVGDIIDHGKFSPQTVEYIFDIKDKHPETVIVRGNHEELFQLHVNHKYDEDWLAKAGEKTFSQYLMYDRRINPDAEKFRKLPLYYETSSLLVSHAGVSETENPFDAANPDGVLYYRGPVKRLDKLQVFGHTPQELVHYDELTNAICIDSGAYKCDKLTALLVSKSGEILDLFEENTHSDDIPEEEI
jgi:serine/threonine protein phosphatase 1